MNKIRDPLTGQCARIDKNGYFLHRFDVPKEYWILGNGEMGELTEIIDKQIETGWMPQGGVCYANGMFYQAMVKYND